MKKSLFSIFLVGLGISCLFCACGKQKQVVEEENTETVELTQNDYRGAVYRMWKVKDDISETLSLNKEKNASIKEERPSDYWNDDNFAILTSEMLNSDIIACTQYLNEEQTTWEDVETYTYAELQENQGASAGNMSRVTDNEYTIYFERQESPKWTKDSTAYRTIDATYDPNHDWAKAWSHMHIFNGDVEGYDKMFEYARSGDMFIIQTETERVVARYKEKFEDIEVEVLDDKGKPVKDKEGNIVTKTEKVSKGLCLESFVYAKLDGNPRDKFLDVSDFLNQKTGDFVTDFFTSTPPVTGVTEEGYITFLYGPADTIFTHIDDIDENWVTSEGTFSDVLIYDGKTLTAKKQNKLSNKIEVFEFDENGNCKKSEEDMMDASVTLAMQIAGTAEVTDEAGNASMALVGTNGIQYLPYRLYDGTGKVLAYPGNLLGVYKDNATYILGMKEVSEKGEETYYAITLDTLARFTGEQKEEIQKMIDEDTFINWMNQKNNEKQQ